MGDGSGGGSLGHSCPSSTTSPTRWSVDQQGNAMPAGARGLGGAGPVSPAPVGADGRPRPRRRRGQRGRRGGGANGNGTPGGNKSGRSGLEGDNQALSCRTCDPDEECVYGPRGLCLVAPQAEWGQTDGCGPGSSLTVTNVEQLAKVSDCQRTISSAVCMRARRPSSSSLSTPKFLGLDDQDVLASGGCAGSACGDFVAFAGTNSGTFVSGGSSNDDRCHPAPKQPSTWGGSERSVGSNRSAGSSYGGGAGRSSSSSYWGKPYSAGRGSPLDTPETLTTTPPVELSPSEPTSSLAMSASFPGLSSLSSRGLWDLGSIGTSGGRNSSGPCANGERGTKSSGSGSRVGAGVFSHRSLRMLSPPAFFGLGTDDGRGGDSLGSISETRQQLEQFQQVRSQSLDLSLDRQNDGRQQQKQHENNLRQWHADGIDGGSSSLSRHAPHEGTQRSNEGLSAYGTVTMRSTATAPPGLPLLAANVGVNGSGGGDEASGLRHSDDRFAAEGRYGEGSFARGTRAGRWDGGGSDQIGVRYGVVGGGGDDGGSESRMRVRGDTDEEEMWATQATTLMAFDPISSSNTTTASQDEVGCGVDCFFVSLFVDCFVRSDRLGSVEVRSRWLLGRVECCPCNCVATTCVAPRR